MLFGQTETIKHALNEQFRRTDIIGLRARRAFRQTGEQTLKHILEQRQNAIEKQSDLPWRSKWLEEDPVEDEILLATHGGRKIIDASTVRIHAEDRRTGGLAQHSALARPRPQSARSAGPSSAAERALAAGGASTARARQVREEGFRASRASPRASPRSAWSASSPRGGRGGGGGGGAGGGSHSGAAGCAALSQTEPARTMGDSIRRREDLQALLYDVHALRRQQEGAEAAAQKEALAQSLARGQSGGGGFVVAGAAGSSGHPPSAGAAGGQLRRFSGPPAHRPAPPNPGGHCPPQATGAAAGATAVTAVPRCGSGASGGTGGGAGDALWRPLSSSRGRPPPTHPHRTQPHRTLTLTSAAAAIPLASSRTPGAVPFAAASASMHSSGRHAPAPPSQPRRAPTAFWGPPAYHRQPPPPQPRPPVQQQQQHAGGEMGGGGGSGCSCAGGGHDTSTAAGRLQGSGRRVTFAPTLSDRERDATE